MGFSYKPPNNKISETMQSALDYANKHGGKLTRYPGGFWCRGDLPRWERPWFGTSTIEALVSRGRMTYSQWMEGRSRFPIEATVSIQREGGPQITTKEGHGALGFGQT